MFKRIAIFLALAIFLQIVLFDLAHAGTLEFQAKQVGNADVWKYTCTVGFGEKLSPTLGWTGFVLCSKSEKNTVDGWGEAYVGPTYSPKPWMTVALCAGIQNAAQVSRFAGWYSLNHGHWSIFHVVEDGSGRWHKLLAMYNGNAGTIGYRFGLWDQDSLGRGPRLEIQVPCKKARTSLYAAVLWDGDVTNNAVGLLKSF